MNEEEDCGTAGRKNVPRKNVTLETKSTGKGTEPDNWWQERQLDSCKHCVPTANLRNRAAEKHCVGKGRSRERRQSPESYVMATRRQGRAHVWCQALQGKKHFCAWISIFACSCGWAEVQEQLVAVAPSPTSVAMETRCFRIIASWTENSLWMILPNNWFLSTPALEQQVKPKPTWSWASPARNFSLTSLRTIYYGHLNTPRTTGAYWIKQPLLHEGFCSALLVQDSDDVQVRK